MKLNAYLHAANDRTAMQASNYEQVKNVLSKLHRISWNLAGLNKSHVLQLYEDITMTIYWSIMFVQEFGAQTTASTIETCNNITYIFPGISKQSRSNAISVTSILHPYVFFPISALLVVWWP